MFVLCQCVGHVPWISRLRIECPGLVPLGAPSPHQRSVRVVACIIRDVAAKVPRRNPPRPTDNEQHIQHTHTHQCASCASRQRPTWPATCASIKHLCNGGERRKTHASSCISLSNPMVRSTSALYRSARLPYLAPAPGSRVPAPSAQKIKRQLCLAEICPAVTQ